MTFSVGHVQNGTGAGWRRTRAKYEPWPCECKNTDEQTFRASARKINPGYLKKCIDCGTPRA
jgi:hypothetical protein